MCVKCSMRNVEIWIVKRYTQMYIDTCRVECGLCVRHGCRECNLIKFKWENAFLIKTTTYLRFDHFTLTVSMFIKRQYRVYQYNYYYDGYFSVLVYSYEAGAGCFPQFHLRIINSILMVGMELGIQYLHTIKRNEFMHMLAIAMRIVLSGQKGKSLV